MGSHPRHHLDMPDEFWVWLERNRYRTLGMYYDLLQFRKSHSRTETAVHFHRTPARVGKVETQFLNRFAAYKASPFYPSDSAKEFIKAGGDPAKVPVEYLMLTGRAAKILHNEHISTLAELREIDPKEMRRWCNCGEVTIKEIREALEKFSDD